MKLSNLCHKKRSGVWWIDAPKWNTWDSLSLPIFSKIILSQISTKVNEYYTFAPGPRVYLKMDEGSGTSANDPSGNGRTGTINGNPVWAPGKYGGGLKMDGTGDDIQVSDF